LPEAVHYRGRTPRPGKLTAFEGHIVAWLASALPERLAASVLLRELRERDYIILKDFVAGLQPIAVPEPVVRFETVPGEQMQVDWATGHGPAVGVRGYARLEPDGLCRVRHRRAAGDAAGGA
jgi:transposase